MPSVSEKQRRLFCIALSIKRGKAPKWYSKEANRLAETMTKQQLEDYCRGIRR